MLWAVGFFETRIRFFSLEAAARCLVVSARLPELAAFVFPVELPFAVDCFALAVEFPADADFFVCCVEDRAVPANGTIPASKTPTATLAFIQLLNSTSLVFEPSLPL